MVEMLGILGTQDSSDLSFITKENMVQFVKACNPKDVQKIKFYLEYTETDPDLCHLVQSML
jgi:hypothetical protein